MGEASSGSDGHASQVLPDRDPAAEIKQYPVGHLECENHVSEGEVRPHTYEIKRIKIDILALAQMSWTSLLDMTTSGCKIVHSESHHHERGMRFTLSRRYATALKGY